MLAIKELGVSHQGKILAKVVHRVIKEYDLTKKVSNILPFLYFQY